MVVEGEKLGELFPVIDALISTGTAEAAVAFLDALKEMPGTYLFGQHVYEGLVCFADESSQNHQDCESKTFNSSCEVLTELLPSFTRQKTMLM